MCVTKSMLLLYAIAVELCDVMRQTSQKPTFEIFNHDVFERFFYNDALHEPIAFEIFYKWRSERTVLPCVAVCCSVLQGVSVGASELAFENFNQWRMECSVLQCAVACCSVLHCATVC